MSRYEGEEEEEEEEEEDANKRDKSEQGKTSDWWWNGIRLVAAAHRRPSACDGEYERERERQTTDKSSEAEGKQTANALRTNNWNANALPCWTDNESAFEIDSEVENANGASIRSDDIWKSIRLSLELTVWPTSPPDCAHCEPDHGLQACDPIDK
jgi:hypothetical protein